MSSGLSIRSNTSRTVQPQNMGEGLKFCILEVVEMYYLCNENISFSHNAKIRFSHDAAQLLQ